MDTNLDFQWHLKNIQNKVNEMISLLYKPHNSAYNPFVNLILTAGVSRTIRHTTFYFNKNWNLFSATQQ